MPFQQKPKNFAIADQSFEPYIGPNSFTKDIKDQRRFFGRVIETDEIVSLIISHRIVLIYAASGVGKTSIFNAKIIPTLENYGFEVLPLARVQPTITESAYLKDNNDKNQYAQVENFYIRNAIQSLNKSDSYSPASNLYLFEYLDSKFPNSKGKNREIRPQVLIFDQLEEVFTSFPEKWTEQQYGFFEQVYESLENNPNLRIVFIIREDFLAQLDPFKNILPERLKPRYRLERLRRYEALQAIKGPLEKIMVYQSEQEIERIESEIEGLVKDLLEIYVESPEGDLRSVEGEFIEPIHLQIVCQRWWRERKSTRVITKIKRSQDLSKVDIALEDFYDDIIITTAKTTGISEKKIREWIGKN